MTVAASRDLVLSSAEVRLNRTDPIEHMGQNGLSVSRVQLRLPSGPQSVVSLAHSLGWDCGTDREWTIHNLLPSNRGGDLWPFQHSFEECTPYLLHILPFGFS